MSELATAGKPWSRKRTLKENAAMARASRHQRLQEEVHVASESDDFNESFSLPRVEVLSDDECEDTVEFIPQEFYKEWIRCQSKYTIKIMALILMDTFRTRFGLTDVAAATEAGLVVGYNERSIRDWRKEFYDNEGEFHESLKGKYHRPYVLDDENCQKKALTWLHERAYDKDQPCMTAYSFANWVNLDLLPNSHLPPGFPQSITVRTARKWLHKLGFSPKSSKKGLYFDGHERGDVVEYRKLYLRKLEILQSTHLPPPACFSGQTEESIGNVSSEKRLVLIYHDESVFHANDAQSWQWAEEDKITIRPKSQGRGLMISDFIEEHGGYLQLTTEEHEVAKLSEPNLPLKARVVFKFGSQGDGYWNNELFINQVKSAISIAEFKYPKEQNTIMFLFDQSSGHCAYADDALVAHRMNVSDGGKQPFLRDTIWDGKLQKLVTEEGIQKGLKSLLEERGVNTAKLKKDEMIKIVEEMRDFKFQKTKVEEMILSKGHRVMFIPKFHCELNPIERVWCHAKQYTRTHCDYTFAGLEKTIDAALNSMTVELVRKYFRKVREYQRAYREGNIVGKEMQNTLKIYKSHRRVLELTT